MRSVVVVLPASMCAMIPMFRVLSIATGRSAILSATFISLIPEMTEGLVAFSHSMGLFLPLHRTARVLAGVEDLERELLGHAPAATLAGEAHDPPAGKRQPPVGPDLDRHLVGRAANAARLDFQERSRVAERSLENLEGLLL